MLALLRVLLATAAFGSGLPLHAIAEQRGTPAQSSMSTKAQGFCVESLVHVTAPSSGEHTAVCTAALQAVQMLSSCKIALKRPLHVGVTDRVSHPDGRPVLGFFDVKHETVVLRTRRWMASHIGGGPFERLPQAELYASIVVHEVVHGVLHQNTGQFLMSHTAGEYIAYALQIASLPVGARQNFLATQPLRGNPKEFVFSDILHSLAPFLFAAQAYEHFAVSAEPCRYAELLQRELEFVVPAY